MDAPQAGRRAARRRGMAPAFTLLETAMTTVIIGVGILAMVEAQQAFVQSNLWSSHAAAGTFLAGEVREYIRNLPRHDPVVGLMPISEGGPIVFGPESNEITLDDYDDVDDFAGLRFGAGGDFEGPIDATGAVIPELDLLGNVVLDDLGRPVPMVGWMQEVLVEKVEPHDYSIVREEGYYRESQFGELPAIAVDAFPVRVTVIVWYTPPGRSAMEVARLSWVVP